MKKIAIFVDQLTQHGGIEKLVAIKANYWATKFNYKVTVISTENKNQPLIYKLDPKVHFMDLKITYKNGRTVLVEIKPDKETKPPAFNGKKTKRYITEGLTYVKNMNKWAAAQNYAADRGWGFQIWTEDTLHEMGIKPKSTKPLKPYKKPKKKT